jgi:hypothetical protein
MAEAPDTRPTFVRFLWLWLLATAIFHGILWLFLFWLENGRFFEDIGEIFNSLGDYVTSGMFLLLCGISLAAVPFVMIRLALSRTPLPFKLPREVDRGREG